MGVSLTNKATGEKYTSSPNPVIREFYGETAKERAAAQAQIISKAKAAAHGNSGKPGQAVSKNAATLYLTGETARKRAASQQQIVSKATPATQTAAAQQEGFDFGKFLLGTLGKGTNAIAKAGSSTLAFAEKTILEPLFPGITQSTPIQDLNKGVDKDAGALQDYAAENLEKGGKAARIAENVGVGVISAVPQAVVAAGTGGASLGAQGLSTAAQASPTIVNTLKNGVSKMAKNPSYWTSFLTTVGNNYESAKQNGADDTRASLYALVDSLIGSAVEVAGGIQTLPAELQGGRFTARKWIDAMLDEGKEEVVQGIISRGLENVVYNKGNAVASVTDKNAILNPLTSAEEFGMGAAVGGILSGAQGILANTAQNPAGKGAGTQAVSSEGKFTPTKQTGVQVVSGGVMEQEAHRLYAKENPPAQGTGYAATDLGRPSAPLGVSATQKDNTSVAPSARNASENVDPLLKLLTGGKRVDQSTLTNEQFDALADRADIGMDAKGRVFQMDPAQHIDLRRSDEMGNRNINAFQFDHPQLHPYFRRAAGALIADADLSMQFGVQRNVERTVQGKKVRQKAQTSQHLRHAMDETGLSRHEIIDAAQRIVNDKGQENVKAAKQVELILDDMLTHGWQPMMGKAVAPNEAYIVAKNEIASIQPAESRHSLDGIGAADAGFDPFTAAQNQYGTQESGENSVRSDDVPVSVDGETKVSHTIVTAKGAQVTPDEFVPLIENETMKGGFSFIPITNDQSVEAAKKYITDRGWPQARADWTADVRKGKAGDQITAVGALLYNNAVNAGDNRAALEILDDYQFAVRTSARGLQAARIMKTLSPENRLYMIRRSIQRMVEDLKLGEDIQLPDNLVNAYMGAKTDAEVNSAVSDIQQYVADQLPSTLLDMWTALRYVNMLGNFKTQVRNVAGNIGMRAVSTAQNAVATFFEAATGGRFGKTRSVFVDGSLKNAAKQDFQAVREQALSGGKYKLDEANAFAQGVKDKQKVFRGVLAPLEGYRKATNWAMNNQYFGDEGFIKGAYARYLAGYLKANGVTAEQFSDPQWQKANGDFVDQARSFAVQQAQEVTFRDSNTLSNWVSKLGRRGDTPKAVKMASEGMMPFRKTPANVLLRAEEYSPIGFVNTLVQAVKATKGEATGTDVINSLSKTLTGTGIFIAGMALASAGMLRGGGTGDDEQGAFDDLTGHQDYSLILDDGTSITLDWLTPASMPLFMGAELERLRQEGDVELKDLEVPLTSILEPMMQMSMLQGVNDTLSDLKYAQDANLIQIAATAALGYLTQGLTNSLVGQISRSTKEESMTTYVDKDSAVPAWLQREIGAASRKFPGDGYNQIPYIDAWGRTEATGDALERSINNLFNPAYVSQVDVDDLEAELQRLKDATGSTGVFPERAGKSIEFDNETHNLSADQYQNYATTLGQGRYALAKEAMSLPAYRNMSDGERVEFLTKMYGYADYKAKKSLFSAYDNAAYAKYAAAEAVGMSPADYYVMKQTYDYDHSNQSGQPTQAEAQRYLDTETDLSRSQKADLWTIISKDWKNNPYA